MHRNVWRSIALSRLRQSSDEQDFVGNLLEHGLAVQDDVIVRALIRPHFPSRGETVHGNTWGAIAQDLVKETLEHHAERLTPLHVEALHRSITVMEPYQDRISGEQPAGFDSALRLLLRCLEHPDRRIQEAALQCLSTGNLSGPGLARQIEDALERVLQNPDFSAAPETFQTTARSALETIRATTRARYSP